MDKRLKQWEKAERQADKQPVGRSDLTEEEELALRKQRIAAQEEAKKAKKERKQIREIAKKSLDVGHWTSSVLEGGAKFNTANTVVENKLASAVTGLMTKEQFKERREALEAEEADMQAKRKAAEAVGETKHVHSSGAASILGDAGAGAGGNGVSRKKKKLTNKATLSFDVDDEEEEG